MKMVLEVIDSETKKKVYLDPMTKIELKEKLTQFDMDTLLKNARGNSTYQTILVLCAILIQFSSAYTYYSLSYALTSPSGMCKE